MKVPPDIVIPDLVGVVIGMNVKDVPVSCARLHTGMLAKLEAKFIAHEVVRTLPAMTWKSVSLPVMEGDVPHEPRRGRGPVVLRCPFPMMLNTTLPVDVEMSIIGVEVAGEA